MKVIGHERALHQREPLACGSWIGMLAAKPYKRQQFCDRWSCDECRARKIGEIQTELREARLSVTVYVSEHRPPNGGQEMKRFSNFLSKKTKGDYWLIKSDLRFVLISKRAHPGAIRLRTRYIIDALVPDVLREPWNQFKSKRVTRSEGQMKAALERKQENPDSAYAGYFGETGSDAAMKEFGELKTDHERAEWLLKHKTEPKLTFYARGRKVIGRFQAENE